MTRIVRPLTLIAAVIIATSGLAARMRCGPSRCPAGRRNWAASNCPGCMR